MRGETERGDREKETERACRSVRGETERGDREGDRERERPGV